MRLPPLHRFLCAFTLTAALLRGTAPPPAAAWQADFDAAAAAIESYNYSEAVHRYRDALKIAEKFGEADPRLLQTLTRLASACSDADDCSRKDGEAYLSRALRIRAKAAAAQNAQSAADLAALGQAASIYARYSEALLCYGEALKIRERLLQPGAQEIAATYTAIAWVYQWKGDKTQARNTFQYAVDIREQAGAGGSAEFAALLDDLASLYDAQQDQKAAIATYERAIAIRERLWKLSDPLFIGALKRVAENAGNFEFAERLLLRVVDIQRQSHTEKSEEYYEALKGLAEFREQRDRPAEAEAAYAGALSARRKFEPDGEAAAECLQEIATLRQARKLYREAAAAAEESVAIRTGKAGDPSGLLPQLYSILTLSYAKTGDAVKSEQAFAALRNQISQNASYWIISTAEALGDDYYERGSYAQAAEKFEVAVATLEAGGSGNPQLLPKMLKLSRAYQAMGRTEDANRLSMRILQLSWQQAWKNAPAGAARRALIAGALVFGVGALVIGAILLVTAYFMARSLDRRLVALYAPQPVAPIPVAAPAGGGAAPPQWEPQPAALPPVEASAAGDAFAAFEPEPALVVAGNGSDESAPLPPAPPAPIAVLTEAEPFVPPQPPPVSTLSFHGLGARLFAIQIRNLLLSLLTLGVYYFWGKARARRYVYGQTEYAGDRFAFHGTGKELLLGWLRGLPILAFVVLFPRILPLVWQSPYAPAVAAWSIIGAMLLLWPVAKAGAYRYRLNRMSWRGIRFSFRGSTWRFLLLNLRGYLLVFITFGIYRPFFDVRLRRFLSGQTWFGNTPFRYSGRGRDLLPSYLVAVPLTVLTLGLYWAWWSALQSRYDWSHTEFAGARCRSTVTGPRLLWLWLGNLLILAPTLGLGISWVIVRTARFWTRHVQLVGTPDLAAIAQDAQAASAVGESFADFLGFDFGF